MKKKIFVIIIGIVFLAIGIFVFKQENDLIKRCTAEVQGTVVEIEHEISSDSDGYDHYTYYPVIEYNAGEQTVRKRYRVGSNPSSYSINDEVNVMYDPNKVEDYIIKGDKSSNIFGIIFAIVGIGITAIGIVKKDFN